MLNRPGTPRRTQRGLSLVELMVGITIGMIVVAGASVMMVNQLAEHRRLVLETQVQQDLRAAADLMLRDLRRAGFWATPQKGVWAPDAADPIKNVYSALPEPAAKDGSELLYSYSRAGEYVQPGDTPEDNRVTADELFGFKLSSSKVLQSKLGNQWQPLTDPDTLLIRSFKVNLQVQQLPLGDYCTQPCPAGSTTCPPQQEIRRFDIELTGQARHDDKVVRTIKVSSRLRNDNIVGSCPP